MGQSEADVERQRRRQHVALGTLATWLADHPRLPPVDWYVSHRLEATADLDLQRAHELVDSPPEAIVPELSRWRWAWRSP
jgi:hypothetical protein